MLIRLTTPMLMVMIAIALTGCSSIRSRNDTSAEAWTVFPGIQRDATDMAGTLTGKVQPLWTSALVGPVLLADVPFSLAMDTLALPYDLSEMGQKGKTQEPANSGAP